MKWERDKKDRASKATDARSERQSDVNDEEDGRRGSDDDTRRDVATGTDDTRAGSDAA